MKKLGDKGEAPVLLARIPRDMKTAVKARARQEKLSISELVRLALEDYLAKPAKPKRK